MSFQTRERPDRSINISHWRDDAALAAWMSNPAHRRAIPIGNDELLSRCTIQIAEVVREKRWNAHGLEDEP